MKSAPRFLLMCLALLSTLWLGTAHALPTVDQVQAAVQRGDHAGAEKMMREVVAARPDSPRAHYVLAELLARQRQFAEAAEHTRRARALDPAISFTDPARFSAFEQLLAAQARPAVPDAPGAVSPPPQAPPAEPVERAGSFNGVPIWLWVAGAILVAGLVSRFMRRRTPPPAQPAFAGGYAPGAEMMRGANMAPPMSGGGSGLMGVGLGVAGGVAAGMLAERLLNNGPDPRSLPHNADAGSGAGGLIPGSFDGGGVSDLTNRDIDFGSGDGWGGGGGDSGGGGGGDDW